MATIISSLPAQNVTNMSYAWSTQHKQFCNYHVIQIEILRTLRSTFMTSLEAESHLTHLTHCLQNFCPCKMLRPNGVPLEKNLSWYLLK